MGRLAAEEQSSSSSSCALVGRYAGKPDTISLVYFPYSTAIDSMNLFEHTFFRAMSMLILLQLSRQSLTIIMSSKVSSLEWSQEQLSDGSPEIVTKWPINVCLSTLSVKPLTLVLMGLLSQSSYSPAGCTQSSTSLVGMN